MLATIKSINRNAKKLKEKLILWAKLSMRNSWTNTRKKSTRLKRKITVISSRSRRRNLKKLIISYNLVKTLIRRKISTTSRSWPSKLNRNHIRSPKKNLFNSSSRNYGRKKTISLTMKNSPPSSKRNSRRLRPTFWLTTPKLLNRISLK